MFDVKYMIKSRAVCGYWFFRFFFFCVFVQSRWQPIFILTISLHTSECISGFEKSVMCELITHNALFKTRDAFAAVSRTTWNCVTIIECSVIYDCVHIMAQLKNCLWWYYVWWNTLLNPVLFVVIDSFDYFICCVFPQVHCQPIFVSAISLHTSEYTQGFGRVVSIM